MRNSIITVVFLAMSMGAMAQTQKWTDSGNYRQPVDIDNQQKSITISSAEELAWVANQVNTGENDFGGYTITLADDIGTLDMSAYEWDPIGYGSEDDPQNSHYFKGTFDGNGKTISGIHVNTPKGWGVGLFGYIHTATIKNVTLADCSFVGQGCVGGIVGNNGGSTPTNQPSVGIYNCHVGSGVSVTATNEEDVEYGGAYAGGIIGYLSYITVRECTSLATVEGKDCVGGIAGILVGDNNGGIIDDSYYLGNGDAETSFQPVGARGLLDDNDTPYDIGTIHITLYDDDTVDGNINININNVAINNEQRISCYLQNTVDVIIKGRTLYKDEKWNTLCLPFEVTEAQMADATHPLHGATVKTLTSSTFYNGTLTLDFSENNLNAMDAGKPYIVKWETAGDHISDLVFDGVTITSKEPTDAEGTAANFHGIYSSYSIGSEDNTMLYLGENDRLYFPNINMNINAFRAYFKLNNGLTAKETANGINNFVINFGGETNIIENGILKIENQAGAWYDIQGRRLSGKPSVKGLYTINGRKVVIK